MMLKEDNITIGEPHTHVDDDEVEDLVVKAKETSLSESKHIPIFDEENFQEEERLKILKEKELIDQLLNGGTLLGTFNQVEVVTKEGEPTVITTDEEETKFLFGKGTLVGTKNQVDDDKFAVVNVAVESKEELETVNTLKVFDKELKLIEECLEKIKYDEKYQNNFVYDHVYDVDKFFKFANHERCIQPKVAEEEKGGEEEEEEKSRQLNAS